MSLQSHDCTLGIMIGKPQLSEAHSSAYANAEVKQISMGEKLLKQIAWVGVRSCVTQGGRNFYERFKPAKKAALVGPYSDVHSFVHTTFLLSFNSGVR
jgi:hypothetical protein